MWSTLEHHESLKFVFSAHFCTRLKLSRLLHRATLRKISKNVFCCQQLFRTLHTRRVTNAWIINIDLCDYRIIIDLDHVFGVSNSGKYFWINFEPLKSHFNQRPYRARKCCNLVRYFGYYAKTVAMQLAPPFRAYEAFHLKHFGKKLGPHNLRSLSYGVISGTMLHQYPASLVCPAFPPKKPKCKVCSDFTRP